MKGVFRVFELEVDVLADKMQAGVADQGSGQQAGLAKDLKAVADAKNKFAVRSKFF